MNIINITLLLKFECATVCRVLLEDGWATMCCVCGRGVYGPPCTQDFCIIRSTIKVYAYLFTLLLTETQIKVNKNFP